jgi:Domain of unknown function (DUF4136)
MKRNLPNGARQLKVVVAGLLMLALAACAQPFRADVSRFQSQLPAPAGQTFAVVADDPALSGGIEFSQYARLVEANLARVGYQPIGDPARADLIVRFNYGVDNGRTRIRSTGFGHDPFWSPWYGYGYGGYGGWGRYGHRSFYGPGLWNYGWYDPWFDNHIESYTVYTSGIDLKIDRRAGGVRLFEGKAEAVSTSNRLQYLVPNLIEAMFTNFPGNSGEAVRITVAPEKNQPRDRASY